MRRMGDERIEPPQGDDTVHRPRTFICEMRQASGGVGLGRGQGQDMVYFENPVIRISTVCTSH